MPRNQCEGIKKYIVGLIIKTSSDPVTLENSKVYLNKLNMILVQVHIFHLFTYYILIFIQFFKKMTEPVNLNFTTNKRF